MSKNYTPKNEWEQQYEREYKRITQAIRRQEKLGYYVPKEVKPTPPSKVKVMSPLEVEKLINLTPKEIRKKSVLTSKETGEANGLQAVNSNRKVKSSSSQTAELKVPKNIGQIKAPHQPKDKKPKTELEQQYAREYRRITSAIRRQEKLGYYVPKDIRPLPPSKVDSISPTDVEKLINLTPKEIRKNSVWIDQETGEAYHGLDIVKSNHKARPSNAKLAEPKEREKTKQITEPTKHKRKKKKREPENTAPPKENNLNMQIIDSITEMIERWTPSPHWNTSWLERKTTIYIAIRDKWFATLNKEGAYQVAYRMENNALLYNTMVDRLLHASDDAVEDNANLNTFITFLTNEALTAEESDAYSTYATEYIRDSIMGDSFG